MKVYSIFYYEDLEDYGIAADCLGVFHTKEDAVKKMYESFTETKESKFATETDPIDDYKSEDYCRILSYFDKYEWRLQEWEI